MSHVDDGVVNDYGWGSQWSDGQLRASGAVKYKGGRHWRDYNDLQILTGARIVGESPDHPGLIRVSYHTGLHGECLADLENWDDPGTKAEFCNHVRGYVKSMTTSKQGDTIHGMTREEFSARNKALNEGRAPQQWSNDPMQLLGPNGAPIAQPSPTPGGSAMTNSYPNSPAPAQAGVDPVAALQQQLTQQYTQMQNQQAQYQQALGQLQIQMATIEQQLNAINAAAAASAALQPPQPIAVPATQVPAQSAPSLHAPTGPAAPETVPAVPTPVTPAPEAVAVVEPVDDDIGEISPEPAAPPPETKPAADITLPEGL